MSTLESSVTSMVQSRPVVRRIDEADLNWALSEGWKDFKAKRGDLIVLALIYPIVGLIAAAAAFNDRVLPMLFPLVAGLSILGPAVATGFYELARRREAGLESSWIHFVDPLKGRGRAGLALLTGGLIVLFGCWLLVAWAIYSSTLGGFQPGTAGQFLNRLFSTPEGWTMIVVGNLAGFGFAALTLAVSLVSFPLEVDKSVNAVVAVSTSLRAVAANPKAATSWGLKVAGLLALGCLPLFIGLAVVLPVVGYASWHLYTRLIAR